MLIHHPRKLGQHLQRINDQRTWLRHYGTSRKVVGSIPDGVIGFFNLPELSSRTMDLRSTQSLTEMSARYLLRG
jgi:hypothetical protein